MVTKYNTIIFLLRVWILEILGGSDKRIYYVYLFLYRDSHSFQSIVLPGYTHQIDTSYIHLEQMIR